MYNLNVIVILCSLLTIIVGNTSVKTNSYCEIHEEIFSNFYNLTKLTKPGEDIVINKNSNEIIRMQLCSPLMKKCNGKDGYSICLRKDNKEIGIGKALPTLETKSGQIHFAFTGDQCKPGIQYTVNVTMKCDYSVTNYSIPTIFEDISKPCYLHMMWITSFACATRKDINCAVVDSSDNSHYDLSLLKQYSENYVIYAGNNTSLKITLNICHSVIFGYDALCHMNSGACLYDPTKAHSLGYVNLGDVQNPPTLDSSKNLKLEYEEGSICNNGNHIRTSIIFVCDLEAKDTLPVIIKSDECHYNLKWITAAACSLEKLREHSLKTAGKCTINNPTTNFVYDLQSLMDKDFNVTSSQGTKYNFRICGATTDKTCKVGTAEWIKNNCRSDKNVCASFTNHLPYYNCNTGVCLKENGTSLGMANTNLMWQQAGPYLNYTGGDKCNTNQYHQTLITFFCGPEGTSNDPFIVEENPCQLVIRWNHNLICETRTKCITADKEVNLNPLVRSTSNYIVKANNSVFYINVCRPIIPTPGLKCPQGSGICKVVLNSNGEPVEEVNLGFSKEMPQINKDQTILRYLKGSQCPEKTDTRISSVFTFLCNNKNEDLPEFKEYKNCTYFFEWKTSTACGAIMGDWISPCTIKDRFLSNQFDLSFLYKKQQIHYVKSKDKNYSISICGGQKNCTGSAVCQGVNSYGSLSNVIFDYNRNIIKLEYLNGSKCFNSSYASEIKFVCNETIEIGEPRLLWESQCRADFEWYTNVTCINRSNKDTSSTVVEKQEGVQSSSSHAGLIAAIVIILIKFLLAFMYFRKPSKRAHLYSCLNFCNSRRGSGRVQYCRVGTTEQARLLLDANDSTQCQSDSDDDLLDA